ncbi:hypothetical protein SCLCIDRAFT_720974 [Scleroderma citrinum Foug A]|uniref:Profilin n=1 Tax=Scleroderma citrinum Foug A TaxID=1036808 RepID=A0A0C3ENE7_9AGAM|nr:hypothetical protein SCLCIDRAFT_720974 [Scleroderma citrinum Foug A]
MSWQVYVDSNLVGTGKVARAAILGQKGGVWAASAGFTLTPEEQKAITAAFGNLGATQASGVRLAGQKFFVTRTDEVDSVIHGRKQNDGCTIVKTKQAILVTEYDAPTQAQESFTVVDGLAKYLRSVGY